MFAVAVQKLNFMIAVISAVFPITQRDYCVILAVLGYRVKRSTLLVLWHRQRLVHNSSFTYIFCQSLPTLQRGLSATADLLVNLS